MCDDVTCMCDDVTYMCDDVTYMCDDVTYMCDDVTNINVLLALILHQCDVSVRTLCLHMLVMMCMCMCTCMWVFFIHVMSYYSSYSYCLYTLCPQ